MNDAIALLTALQFGDGQFPAGGFAFSWGLESLITDGRLTRADFPAFAGGQIQHRWGPSDRVILAHAHATAGELAPLLDLDDRADAFLTTEAIRIGSRRAGGALLGTHLRLGTPGAAMLRDAVERGAAHGHLAVVQGAMLAGAGLDARATVAVSAYGLVQALCTAAIRLSLIGHLDAQRTITDLRPCIAALVNAAVPPIEAMHSFAPLADIAAMRHAEQAQRLFSN